MTGTGWVGDDEFRKALRPMVDATRSLTDAITTMRSERTQPDAGSLAMREIQDDASYGAAAASTIRSLSSTASAASRCWPLPIMSERMVMRSARTPTARRSRPTRIWW